MAWNGQSQVPTILYSVAGKLQFFGPKYISQWGSGVKYYFNLHFSQQKLQIEGHFPATRKWCPSLLMLSKAALSGSMVPRALQGVNRLGMGLCIASENWYYQYKKLDYPVMLYLKYLIKMIRWQLQSWLSKCLRLSHSFLEISHYTVMSSQHR